MSDDPRDPRLDEAYRDASHEAPPPDLDARILAAAHRAVHARPEDAERRPGWIGRYRVPLSVAATVVIAVTVSLLIEDETRRAPEPDAPLSAPPHDAPWGSRSAAPPAPPALPRVKERAPAAAGAPLPAEAPKAAEPSAISDLERRLDDSKLEQARSRQSVGAANESSPAAAPASPAAPAAAAESNVDMSRERAAQERPSRLTRDEVPGLARQAAPRPPEEWLGDIRRLRAEGRLADADEALAAFQRAYPDYPLPADLRRP